LAAMVALPALFLVASRSKKSEVRHVPQMQGSAAE
jgi:hypothetical protein